MTDQIDILVEACDNINIFYSCHDDNYWFYLNDIKYEIEVLDCLWLFAIFDGYKRKRKISLECTTEKQLMSIIKTMRV